MLNVKHTIKRHNPQIKQNTKNVAFYGRSIPFLDIHITHKTSEAGFHRRLYSCLAKLKRSPRPFLNASTSLTLCLAKLKRSPRPFLNASHTVKEFGVIRLFFGIGITLLTYGLTACQTLPQQSATASHIPNQTLSFNITGKIGVVTPEQSGSAFYAWAQQDNRFAIDLTGALGIGHTYIEGNGTHNTLINEKTGTLTASTPEELLYTATRWQAPISVLPYWIMARSAPNQTSQTQDETGRLLTATFNQWSVKFSYSGEQRLPKKLLLSDGNSKVVLTIFH